jgi:hypothetical protein
VLGLLYVKMRDPLCSGFGLRHSWRLWAGLGILAFLIPLASGAAFGTMTLGNQAFTLDWLYPWLVLGTLFPLAFAVWGWTNGPCEQRQRE